MRHVTRFGIVTVMSALSAPIRDTSTHRRTGPVLLLAVLLLCAASFALFLVMPFSTGGLDGRFWSLGSWLTLLIAPVVAFAAMVCAACRLWDERRAPTPYGDRGRRAVHALVVLGGLSLFGWLITPSGSAMMIWVLD